MWCSWGTTIFLAYGCVIISSQWLLGAEPIQLARNAASYEENADRTISNEPPLLTPSLAGDVPIFDADVIDRVPQRELPASPIRVSANTVSALRRESRSSFERGLLPLMDHIEQIALAERAAVMLVPRDRGTEPWPVVKSSVLLRALEPRLQDLRNCVERLERFAQPASAGYEADLILARWALLDAQIQSAWLTGKSEQVPQLLAEQQVQARHLYRQRLFDYHVLGTANLPEVSQAIAMLNLSPRYQLATQREFVQLTDHWHNRGAGIGSRSAQLNAELAYLGLQASIGRQREDVSLMARALNDSEIQSRTLFETQSSNWTKGTASLSELSRGWQFRWELHHSAQRMGLPFPTEANQQLDRDLKVLGRAAQSQRDLRGSMASQVLRVGLLQELRATELDSGL